MVILTNLTMEGVSSYSLDHRMFHHPLETELWRILKIKIHYIFLFRCVLLNYIFYAFPYANNAPMHIRNDSQMYDKCSNHLDPRSDHKLVDRFYYTHDYMAQRILDRQ